MGHKSCAYAHSGVWVSNGLICCSQQQHQWHRAGICINQKWRAATAAGLHLPRPSSWCTLLDLFDFSVHTISCNSLLTLLNRLSPPTNVVSVVLLKLFGFAMFWSSCIFVFRACSKVLNVTLWMFDMLWCFRKLHHLTNIASNLWNSSTNHYVTWMAWINWLPSQRGKKDDAALSPPPCSDNCDETNLITCKCATYRENACWCSCSPPQQMVLWAHPLMIQTNVDRWFYKKIQLSIWNDLCFCDDNK